MKLLILLSIFFSSMPFAGEIFVEFPDHINKDEKYVFYSHGFIVEGRNPTPIDHRWGMYDFPKIKEVLSDPSYNLIAYHRPKGTDPRKFAKKLTNNAIALIKEGVKPENITFIGFSRGGAITALTSYYLASHKVNFIMLAACSGFIKNNTEIKVFGNVFSIFETSDKVGSCQFLIDRSKKIKNFEELSISTGKEHGAFYNPLPEWVAPVKNRLKTNRN